MIEDQEERGIVHCKMNVQNICFADWRAYTCCLWVKNREMML